MPRRKDPGLRSGETPTLGKLSPFKGTRKGVTRSGRWRLARKELSLGRVAYQYWTLTSRGMTSPPRQVVTGHCLSPRQCSLGAAYPMTLSAASRPITGWKLRHSPALLCSPVLSTRTPNGVCTQHRAYTGLEQWAAGGPEASTQPNRRLTHLCIQQGSVFRC